MYKELDEIKNKEINQNKIDFIKEKLSKLQKTLIVCRKKIRLRLKRMKR